MRFSPFVLLFVLPALWGQTACAQEAKRFTGDFSGLLFPEFVQRIEAGSSYHFYYEAPELDSLRVGVQANESTLSQLLTLIFSTTDFRFAIDEENIFITRRVPVQTRLPAGYFTLGSGTADTAARLLFEEEREGKKPLQSNLENKLFEIGTKTSAGAKGAVTLAGYVRDVRNGEAIAGASVLLQNASAGVVTDQFGYFALTLPPGRHVLLISGAGMKETRRNVLLYSDGKLNIELEEFIPSLKTVVVSAARQSNVRSTQMGLDRINIRTIKQIPAVLGETDILRVVLALPGVTSVGEASTGFNVRGGSADQNLILLNDATIYNPSHLFGFFSAFNPDVVKGVELYKSGIPEKYGGRLSSVLDVTTRDGNSKEISGVAGIGFLTSKLTVEGPLKKEKTSFIAGGRTTYSNWLLRKVPNTAYKNSEASFQDLDLHVNHILNGKNTLYLNGYLSNDRFRLNGDTLYRYGNKNINARWKHLFNNRLYSVVVAGLDNYQYKVSSEDNPVNAYKLSFNIRQAHLRTDFNYAPNNVHAFNFGLTSVRYQLQPGSLQPSGAASLVNPDVLPNEQALETALYFGDRYTITPRLSVNAGLRYSLFNYLGPRNVYAYRSGLPKDENTLLDTLAYGRGKFIQTYHGAEVRLAARYSFTDDASVKVSYNTVRQYIHMLSNTTAISPTDVWKLSDPHIKPQTGYQAAIGLYKNWNGNTIETSLEFYYKRMRNFLDFKSGARLLLNEHIETDVISTRGKAYGAELLLKKTAGKLNGWISYAYSRTLLQSSDSTAGEVVNRGTYYPASFDKPHQVNFIGNYRFNHRFSLSLNYIYSTGRPITLPIAVFSQGGAPRLLYSDRNQYRVPDYMRVDLSMNLEGNHKVKQKTHNSWSLGVYNLLARQNVYSIYFVQQNGLVKGYKLSIFGTAIPFITYNIRF